MSAGDAVNPFAFAFLIESDGSENRRQDHAWSMNPSERFMKANLAVSLRPRNSGREDGEISAREVQVAGGGTESEVSPAVGRTGALAGGAERGGDGRNQRNCGDQADALMNFQHVRALVEPGLKLRIALRQRGRKTQVLERRRLGVIGRRRLLFLRISLGLIRGNLSTRLVRSCR